VAGTYTAATRDICVKCAPGSSSQAAAAACKACERGTFARKAGEAWCANCTLGTFAAEGGQTACEACPPYTTTLQSGSASPLQCTCLPGASCSYWQEQDFLVNLTAAQLNLTSAQLSELLALEVVEALL
jgi:hypothetical protein